MKKLSAMPLASDDSRTRLDRLRRLAWLLDNSIRLPGGFRIGLDPVIGLIPGIGDAIGALLSVFILNEARILGAPGSVLLRMAGNVVLETVIGAIPFVGDLFDAGFKANARNLALLERYRLDPVRSIGSSRWFVGGFALLLALLGALIISVPILIVVAIVRML
jgi:hypothetical protein